MLKLKCLGKSIFAAFMSPIDIRYRERERWLILRQAACHEDWTFSPV